MSWTRRQIINKAFAFVGLGSFSFDLEPGEQEDARTSLDTMVQGWNVEGLDYDFAEEHDDSDLDDELDLEIWAVEAAYMNLGLLLAEEYGKPVTPFKNKQANQAYRNMLARLVSVPSRPDSTTNGANFGSGNEHRDGWKY